MQNPEPTAYHESHKGESTIATTSPLLSIAAIDALADSGLQFAILHGEARVARSEATSDVDIVAADPPGVALRRARPHLQSVGLYPVMLWPYDVGSTATVLLATEDGSEGVQVDFLCDPLGRGTDGLRSDGLLSQRVGGTRWQVLDPVHEQLYLIRKRDRKGDVDTLAALLREAQETPVTDMERAAAVMFRPDVAERVLDMIRTGATATGPAKPAPGHSVREAQRWMNRLKMPVGSWAEVVSPDGEVPARAVAQRFGRFLPRIGVGRRPESGSAIWWMREVAPVRWRAGLFVSWGERSKGPQADLLLQGAPADIDEMARSLVRWMNARLERVSW